MKTFIMKNWKTTSAGITSILGSVGIFIFSAPLTLNLFTTAVGGIVVGLGLLFAKDGDVTGGKDSNNNINNDTK